MGLGGALLALSAVQAVSSIQQGNEAKKEADRNAQLLEGKAQMIDVQKGIENVQYERQKAQTMASSTAAVAKMGVMMSGSPMAVMIDQQKQIGIDQALGQFNLEQQKRYTLAEAESVKRSGKYAKRAGYTNAFTTALSGAVQYGRYTGGFDLSAGAKTAGRA